MPKHSTWKILLKIHQRVEHVLWKEWYTRWLQWPSIRFWMIPKKKYYGGQGSVVRSRDCLEQISGNIRCLWSIFLSHFKFTLTASQTGTGDFFGWNSSIEPHIKQSFISWALKPPTTKPDVRFPKIFNLVIIREYDYTWGACFGMKKRAVRKSREYSMLARFRNHLTETGVLHGPIVSFKK